MNLSFIKEKISEELGGNKGSRFMVWAEQWAQKQINRGAVIGSDWVFSSDFADGELLSTFKGAVGKLGCGSSSVFEWLDLYPSKCPETLRNRLVAEFNSSFFVEQMKECGVVIDSIGFILSDSIVRDSGSLKHLFIDYDADTSGSPIAMYVNVTGHNNIKGHATLRIEEVEQIIKGQIKYKYGGVNPLEQGEWEDFKKVCLLRRLISGGCFDGLRDISKSLPHERLLHAIQHHNKLYSEGVKASRSHGDEEVYADRWNVIRSKRMFTRLPQYSAAKQPPTEEEVQKVAKQDARVILIKEYETQKPMQQSVYVDTKNTVYASTNSSAVFASDDNRRQASFIEQQDVFYASDISPATPSLEAVPDVDFAKLSIF